MTQYNKLKELKYKNALVTIDEGKWGGIYV